MLCVLDMEENEQKTFSKHYIGQKLHTKRKENNFEISKIYGLGIPSTRANRV
jgi:hypothetical protein